MDWIPLVTSAAAFLVSSICAALGYRRTHGAIPRELHSHDAAINSLRKQNATLKARIRRIESTITEGDPPRHGP